jgi:hypothetical protein
MDVHYQPATAVATGDFQIVKLDLLLRTFFPFLNTPRTDILDLLAVALGERSVACLFVQHNALIEPVFRQLVGLGRSCGCFISDLNGHIGLPAEYVSVVDRETTVPLWLACNSQALLSEMVAAHQELQPQGFTRWAQYLGLKLGYPECCVDTYIEAVRSPGDREQFWRSRTAESVATNRLMIGFAPCADYCKGYQREMIRRLKLARRIGILNAQLTKLWLEVIGETAELDRILAPPVLVDMSSFLSLRVPAKQEVA